MILTDVPLPSSDWISRDAPGLRREAMDLGQAKAGAFADFLGGEERFEHALQNLAEECRRQCRGW